MQRVLWRWGRHLARTHAHTRTHLHTRGWGHSTPNYLCCIFVVAAVLAGFVNRKIDFIYTSVCVCVYISYVCVYIMYVCTHSHSLRRKTTFREYYTHSRALTLTQRHGHWQRLTPAAAQRFDGPKNNNKNNNEQYADRAELQNGSARRKVKNTTETSLGKKYFYSTLGSARLDGGTRNRPTMGLSLVWLAGWLAGCASTGLEPPTRSSSH